MASLSYRDEHLAWQQRVGHEFHGLKVSRSQPFVPALFSSRFSEGWNSKSKVCFRPDSRGSKYTVTKKSKLQNQYGKSGTRFLYANGGKDCRGRYARKAVISPSYQPWPDHANTDRNHPVNIIRQLDKKKSKKQVSTPQTPVYSAPRTAEASPKKPDYVAPRRENPSPRKPEMKRAQTAKSFTHRYRLELEDQIHAEREKRMMLQEKIKNLR